MSGSLAIQLGTVAYRPVYRSCPSLLPLLPKCHAKRVVSPTLTCGCQSECRMCSVQRVSHITLIGALWVAPALAQSPVRPEGYIPSPAQLGWQVWFGAAAAAFPFMLGLVEFSKRIIIQQRCSSCQGSGLVERGSKLRKCNECGGFLPWLGWKQFFSSTAAPGNGGPLRRPKGQTSVLYRVPPPLQAGEDQPSKPQ